MAAFGPSMRRIRLDRGLTLRGLAALIPMDPGHLSRVEAGLRTPTPEAALAIDRALHAQGQLVALAPPTDARAIEVGARESARLADLLASPAGQLVTDVAVGADDLAVSYLAEPAAAMHARAMAARRTAVTAMRRARKAGPATDLTVAVGRLSGVLAYAALDMGNPKAAMGHADLAFRCGEQAGDGRLAAWARGTQSLIARFAGDYPAALGFAQDGLRYAHTGSARVRLLCGVAQCHANLGDPSAARRALAEAERARDQVDGDDVGLFAFSVAKQRYYSGSAGIWLPEPADSRHALEEASAAIALWEAGPAVERSLDDEALAHVYAATAAARLRDVEQAAGLLAPILDLPPERRISWIRKRMARVAQLLAGHPFEGDGLAAELVERIREYC